MDRFEKGLKDIQDIRAIAYCDYPWCKGEIYPGETVVKFRDIIVHEDCYEEIALDAEKISIEEALK
jgi:hypothetical protein